MNFFFNAPVNTYKRQIVIYEREHSGVLVNRVIFVIYSNVL